MYSGALSLEFMLDVKKFVLLKIVRSYSLSFFLESLLPSKLRKRIWVSIRS